MTKDQTVGLFLALLEIKFKQKFKGCFSTLSQANERYKKELDDYILNSINKLVDIIGE